MKSRSTQWHIYAAWKDHIYAWWHVIDFGGITPEMNLAHCSSSSTFKLPWSFWQPILTLRNSPQTLFTLDNLLFNRPCSCVNLGKINKGIPTRTAFCLAVSRDTHISWQHRAVPHWDSIIFLWWNPSCGPKSRNVHLEGKRTEKTCLPGSDEGIKVVVMTYWIG